jgi:putative hydrolase of the HAD superfamily
VLTNPLAETYAHFSQTSGVSLREIGAALAYAVEHDGVHPMSELEVAKISEREFCDRLERALLATSGRTLEITDFSQRWFAGRTPNKPFIDYLRTVRARGYRLALLTNNVLEWEPLWRATIPVDELFCLVVNSAEEGVRKPHPAIYQTTLERLGLPASDCLFVDDVEANCVAAEHAGMSYVRFETTEQAIEQIERHLATDSRLLRTTR